MSDTDYSRLNELTPREQEVLAMLAQGKNFHEIAKALQVTYRTVRSHAERLYSKLDVSSAVEAVIKAHALGLVRLGGLSPVALAISQLLAMEPGALDELERAGIVTRGGSWRVIQNYTG